MKKKILSHYTDTFYERRKNNISLEMKRQESIFKEAFFIHNYESN